jgi:hypothetical protein
LDAACTWSEIPFSSWGSEINGSLGCSNFY